MYVPTSSPSAGLTLKLRFAPAAMLASDVVFSLKLSAFAPVSTIVSAPDADFWLLVAVTDTADLAV